MSPIGSARSKVPSDGVDGQRWQTQVFNLDEALQAEFVPRLGGALMQNPLQLQPAFTIDVPLDKDSAIERLRLAIGSEEFEGLAESAGTVFDFKIERSEQRFWSPHLSAQFSPAETGSQLFARFSPRPEIWTMFIALYFVIMILMSLAAIIGYVQWSLGYAPWSLIIVPLGGLLIGCLHTGSLVGQRLSADQMELLRSRLDKAVEIAFGQASD